MKRGKFRQPRINIVGVGVAVALLIIAGAARSIAGMTDSSATPLDQINNLAAQARSAGGSSAGVANPLTPGSAPVNKFSAIGRLTESLATGGCANNPVITSSCSGGGCNALSLSGQVKTNWGNSALSACFTVLPSTSNPPACLGNGLGVGTITAADGSLVHVSFVGDLCINDEITSPPVTLFLSLNMTYLFEGGTGRFVTKTGTGDMVVSTIFVNPSGSPISGTGELAMTGAVSGN